VSAVSTQGLTRRFGKQLAVAGIDLEVPVGSVYGFLGPNGSGKTTTIRMLLGLIRANEGTIGLLGEPMPGSAARVLPRVGSLIEGPAFHPYLSGRDNLRRLDSCDATADPRTRSNRIGDALAKVGLSSAARKKYRQYSLGMKQRLGIAAALLQDRDLLILDEPTNGLDPQGTREVRHLMRDLAADGATVLVSSHLLSEVQQVATHVGIMSAGKLLAQGPIDDVMAGTATTIQVQTVDLDRAATVMRESGLRDVIVDTGRERISAPLRQTDIRPERLTEALVHAGVGVRGIGVEHAALEDVFVQLTGEGFDVVR
jgi:ABC-type multidrug transport system ATPase subunit